MSTQILVNIGPGYGSVQQNGSIIQAHSPSKLHSAVLETPNPAGGTQPRDTCIVVNGTFKVLFEITLFLECMANSNAPSQDVQW